MKEIKDITRAGAALAVSAASLALGSVLLHLGAAALYAGIVTRRTGRDVVEVLQR